MVFPQGGGLTRADSVRLSSITRTVPTYPHLDRNLGKPSLHEVEKTLEAAEQAHNLERILPLESIFYCQDTIRSTFHDDSPLEPASIQPDWIMHVVEMDGEWFTLNNRLLYTMRKDPKNCGGDKMVRVLVLPDIPWDLRWKWATTTHGRTMKVAGTQLHDRISSPVAKELRRRHPKAMPSPTTAQGQRREVLVVPMLSRILELGLLTLLVGLLVIVADTRHYHSTKAVAARALAGAIVAAVALVWAVIYAYKGLLGPTWAMPTAGAMLSASAGVLVGTKCLLARGGYCS